jgi:hypothetical protein
MAQGRREVRLSVTSLAIDALLQTSASGPLLPHVDPAEYRADDPENERGDEDGLTVVDTGTSSRNTLFSC